MKTVTLEVAISNYGDLEVTEQQIEEILDAFCDICVELNVSAAIGINDAEDFYGIE